MPAQPTSSPRFLAFLVVACLAALAAASLAAPAAAAPPTYRGSSADGEVVFFESEEQLVPGDTDNKRDLYARSFDETVGEDGAYVTREVSVGPTGGNDAYNVLFEQAASDGGRVFFSTEESLVAADTDRETDVYVRELKAGTTKLVSLGAAACLPGCGNGEFPSGFAGARSDEVFLVTAERLVPALDSDGAIDIYERDLKTETTTLVSSGGSACLPACGNQDANATLRGVSADGSTAFFATSESLVPEDSDGAIDIYAHALPAGPTILVSAGDPGCSPCGNSNASAAVFAASSDDGSKVFFATDEGLVPADDDGANDVYQRAGGTTTLVSDGGESKPATFAAAPGNASRVFFVTAESLVGPADANGANDVYMWEGGAPQLVTSGTGTGSIFGAVTDDATAVLFTTTEALLAADEDKSADVYRRGVEGGAPELVSAGDPACSPCGSDEIPARFNRASVDGSRVFFTTDEPLSSQDFDDEDDIYLRDLEAGSTTLATPPPGLCPLAGCDATFVDASDEAAHVFFQTFERLVAEDVDSEPDIYERAFDPGPGADVTRLVSTGNSAELDLGPAAPELKGTTPGSPGESTLPAIIGKAQPGSLIKIYPTATCSGEPVATGTAAQLETPGIQVAVGSGETRSFWATAEAEGFTSLCSNPVSYTQQSQQPPQEPPPSGGGGAPSGGGSGGSGGGTLPKGPDGKPYVIPVAKITFGPAAKTRSARPVFRFTDSTGQIGTRFTCKVDRGRWRPCGSPTRLKRLKSGRHVFRVNAVNAIGTPAARPVSRAFKVVTE